MGYARIVLNFVSSQAMGYSTADAKEALAATDGDIDAAVDFLVNKVVVV